MDNPVYDKITFDDVSEEGVERLRKFLREEPTGTCPDGNTGTASTACFSASFDYSVGEKLLVLQPQKLVEGLRGPRLQKMIESILAPKAVPMLGTAITYPTPHSCASYNWVVGYIQNNTDRTLTYSGQSTQNGDVISTRSKIVPGEGPAQQTDGVFQNQSPKDSTVGCFGSISWAIDGGTTLTLNYGVNTLSSISATPAISGTNNLLYVASVVKDTGFYCACAYLYPVLTLDKYTG